MTVYERVARLAIVSVCARLMNTMHAYCLRTRTHARATLLYCLWIRNIHAAAEPICCATLAGIITFAINYDHTLYL